MERQRWAADLPLLYNTLAVYQSGLAHPLNDWTPTHIRQGFSWRPGSVSFRTLETENIADPVVVEVSDGYTAAPAALRVLKMPFDVGNLGVEVTSPVMDSWALPIPVGQYALFFAIEPGTLLQAGQETSWRYHLTFVPASEVVTAEILRADEELEPPHELLMEAQPAV